MEQPIEPEISPKRSNGRLFSTKVSPVHYGVSSVLINNDIPTAMRRVMDRCRSSTHEYHRHDYGAYHYDRKHVVAFPLSVRTGYAVNAEGVPCSNVLTAKRMSLIYDDGLVLVADIIISQASHAQQQIRTHCVHVLVILK